MYQDRLQSASDGEKSVETALNDGAAAGTDDGDRVPQLESTAASEAQQAVGVPSPAPARRLLRASGWYTVRA
jgi:hypothetical protein